MPDERIDTRSAEEHRVDLIESITADEWTRIANIVRDAPLRWWPHSAMWGDDVERLCQIARLTREIEEQA